MSKGTVKSKPGTPRQKKLLTDSLMHLKPFDFCCSIDKFDPSTKYGQRNCPKKPSSMTRISASESPTLKFRTRFYDYIDHDQITKGLQIKTPDIGDQKHKSQMRQRQTFAKSRSQYKFNKQYDKLHTLKDHKNSKFKRYKQALFSRQNISNLVDAPNTGGNLFDPNIMRLLHDPIKQYLEDEVAIAKDTLRKERIDKHDKETDKNIIIAKKRCKDFQDNVMNINPRWFQDFSINQVKNLMALQSVLYKDCEEMVTGRTQRTLVTIGITSTFFNPASDVIRKLHESSKCNVIDFLREIYKILTGNYFEEEGYKFFYDCNERIILTAIAFLTLPEAVVELHKRLPPVEMPKLPRKPKPPVIPVRKKMDSPYKEELFTLPDWSSYHNKLRRWHIQCDLIAVPKIILPPKECILTTYNGTRLSSDNGENIRRRIQSFSQKHRSSKIVSQAEQNASTKETLKEEKKKHQSTKEDKRNTEKRSNPAERAEQNASTKETLKEEKKKHLSTKEDKRNTEKRSDPAERKEDISTNSIQTQSIPVKRKEESSSSNQPGKKRRRTSAAKKKQKTDATNEAEDVEEEAIDDEEFGPDIPQLPNKNKIFDFTINGISDRPGPVEYKICGVLQPPKPNQKSWLGEKHAHYIISGAPDEPPSCPISYEMTGVANITPVNSDEKFFTVLKLGDGPKKIYPSGRENLSPKWQEWLQNTDEEFRAVESEANKLIKSIEAITRLVFPGPTCDSCCSCRQTRKSYLKAKEMKNPYLVIDTVAEDTKKNKYIVGSMAMHSPAPTPPESTVNLLEYIASKDVLTTNLVINGMTNEKGEYQYFISGHRKDMVRKPGRVVVRPPPPPPRNVPPCACAIQHIFTKGLDTKISHDHIPWTKDEGLCFGKKFRPHESPAYSCKVYPGDKSCRRNPFLYDIKKMKEKVKREREAKEKSVYPKEKKMYSIADFQPCGDEHGMNICGGPWGALHTLTPEELAELEKKRKEILRSPPCGTKPGRAICEGPFGERIPLKKPQVELTLGEETSEDDEKREEEDEESEEEGEEEKKVEPPPVEKKEKKKERQKECYMSPDSIEGRKTVVTKKVEKFIPDPSYPGYDDSWNIFRTAPSKKQSETDFPKLLKLTTPELRVTPKSETKISVAPSPTQKLVSKVPAKESGKSSPSGTSEKQSTKSPPKTSKSDSKIKKNPETKSKSADGVDITQFFAQPQSNALIPSKSKADTKKNTIRDEKSSILKDSKQIQNKINASAKHAERGKSPRKLSTVKSKSDRKKTHSPSKKLTKQSPSKIKHETIPSKKSKTSKTGVDKKPVTRRKSVTRKSEKSLESSLHTTSSEAQEDKRRKKSNRKQNSSPGARRRSSTSAGQKSSAPSKGRKARRRSSSKKKKKHSRDSQMDDKDLHLTSQEQIEKLKNMMKTDMYPYNVQPVELPEEKPAKCTIEYEDTNHINDSEQVDQQVDTQLPSKGPCGWRTASEQQLLPKKTLVYLAQPDYPAETIDLRPGGKPCICRENRDKKKLLLYHIGGQKGKKPDDEANKKSLRMKQKDEDKQPRVIDGLIYYTPPPSPRRSDDYVPEYDLYESPYDMCQTRRKDEYLKLYEEYSGPKSLVSKVAKRNKPCDCNDFVDTYGIHESKENKEEEQAAKEFAKARIDFMEEKPPKERWRLTLNDVGLIEYYSRCRDSLPCWLKCAKFNKVGCRLPRRKLKVKRPVCECEYERKILENKEEKRKFKERRERLQSLKKKPFMNVENISSPLVADTKLMISEVKRIPRDDEYIDDVKYCITGVAENYTHLPPEPVVAGVQMATPIQTPEASTEEIPCVCLHRHWSPINIPPGPIPKPEELLRAENERRKKVAEEAYKQIHARPEVYDTHEGHSCQATCDENGINGRDTEEDERTSSDKQKTVKGSSKKRSGSPKQKKQQLQSNVVAQKTPKSAVQTSPKTTKNGLIETGQNAHKSSVDNPPKRNKSPVHEMTVQKTSGHPQGGSSNKEIRNVSASSAQSYPTQVVKPDATNLEAVQEEETESSTSAPTDIKIILQGELRKMASEGFLFAKLPKCFLMPQLRYWLMYRQGFIITEEVKEKSLRHSILMWNELDVKGPPRAEPQSLKRKQLHLQNINFDHIEKIKEKIIEKKTIFYSQLRKERVLYSRSMWNTMDYGKFPSTSFKKTYFTYMASREADGHVFKPWFPFEKREMDIQN